jgi:hypothetical protein
VAAPAEATWSLLTDWERQSDWAMLTRTHGVGPHGGHAVGEGVHAFTGVGPIGFLDTMVITAWEPPYRCAVRKTGRVVRGSAEFGVEPIGASRSRVVYEAEVDLPAGVLGEMVWPLVRAVLATGFRRSLRTLARLVESSDPVRTTTG